MNNFAPQIRYFEEKDRKAVIALWHECELIRPWNDPNKDIDRKVAFQPEWFFVMAYDENVIGTIMAGYDGHRGSVFYLAIAKKYRGRGLASRLMQHAADELKKAGCPKINLMVRSSNIEVCTFYDKIGYQQEDIVSFGKRLIKDD